MLLCRWREKRVHFPAAIASEVSVTKISKFRLGQANERNSLVDIIRVPSCRDSHNVQVSTPASSAWLNGGRTHACPFCAFCSSTRPPRSSTLRPLRTVQHQPSITHSMVYLKLSGSPASDIVVRIETGWSEGELRNNFERLTTACPDFRSRAGQREPLRLYCTRMHTGRYLLSLSPVSQPGRPFCGENMLLVADQYERVEASIDRHRSCRTHLRCLSVQRLSNNSTLSETLVGPPLRGPQEALLATLSLSLDSTCTSALTAKMRPTRTALLNILVPIKR